MNLETLKKTLTTVYGAFRARQIVDLVKEAMEDGEECVMFTPAQRNYEGDWGLYLYPDRIEIDPDPYCQGNCPTQKFAR